MDAAARKSLEIQTQVRHNAQVYQSTMKDLQNWERDIKEREKNLQKAPQNVKENIEETNSLPVRSHVFEKSVSAKQQQSKRQQNNASINEKVSAKSKVVTTPDEKLESAPDPLSQKRKEAHEIKDVGNRHVKFLQYDLAIDEYSRAIQLCPDEAVFYSNRALCYLKLERYKQCIEDCDRAIQIDKLSVKAYYRRMHANESLGNYMEALKDCTSTLTIEPRNAEAKKSLDRINERLRKNLKSQGGPNFSTDTEDLIQILPIDKPSYKRSNKPLRNVPITDVIGPIAAKNFQDLEISDDDIDKIFNSSCGPFIEVKKNAAASTNIIVDDDKPIVPELIEPNETPKVASSPSQEIKIESKSPPSPSLPSPSSSATADSKTTTPQPPPPTIPKEITKNVQPQPSDNKSITSVKNENVVEAKSSFMPKNEELKSLSKQRPLPPPPTSAAQFYTNWKELSDMQKYEYLSSIKSGTLSRVLGAGFDSDTLTDCLRIINKYYIFNEDVKAAATLLEISQNEEIPVLSLFMSAEDKKVVIDTLKELERKKLINEETVQKIKTNFNIV